MSVQPISRRTVLRGLGVTMALPFLDAMMPRGGAAARAATAVGGGAAGKAAAAAPTRMAMVYIPNGCWMPDFTPAQLGAGFQLTPTLAPLAKVREHLTVLSGLALDAARAKGDGPGDHARSAAAFLTGIHPYKTAGNNIRLGISLDQFAAQKIGDRTRFPSLELGCDKGETAGQCDSGYSCAYTSNISWRSESQPMPKEMDPRALFDRLFGGGGDPAARAAEARRARYRKSILDTVMEDSRDLNRQLGRSDQDKLDEFTSSIREIEKRIEKAAADQATAPIPDMARPEAIPKELGEHMKLMCDLTVMAWRMDLTRITTLMVAREGSNRAYRWLGVTEGHHSLSHHGRKKEKVDAIKKIDLYHMQTLAYFLEKLKATREGTSNLLDRSMILIGSGIGDGDRHNHDELPILMAGRANGAITPGKHVRFPRGTPLCNLYLSMLTAMGVPTDRFGDSTGPLSGMA